MDQSGSHRINCHDDHLISETEYEDGIHDHSGQSISCFTRIKNKICCKHRVYAADESMYDESNSGREHSFSLSRQTMESVQDAIEGKISLSKAKLHRYLTTPNWGPTKKFAPYSIWNFPLALFNDYGIGNKLFFEFTANLSWLFLVLSILNLPVYILLRSGSGIELDESSSGSFEQFSLGNLGDFNSSDPLFGDDTSGSVFGVDLNHRDANTVVALADLVSICVLILFVFCFESTLRRKERYDLIYSLLIIFNHFDPAF